MFKNFKKLTRVKNKKLYTKHYLYKKGEEPVVGTKCFLAGWGYTEEDQASPVLKEVDLDINDINTCTNIYSKLDLISLLHPVQNICAGEKGKDACSGQSLQ